MKKAIGICGGMGPMAGTELHRKIIKETTTDGTDQAHLEVHHLSRSADIPDRSRFLLGLDTINPAHEAVRTIAALEASAHAVGSRLIIGIPCHTFHAPPIFEVFLTTLAEMKSLSVILPMTAVLTAYLALDPTVPRKIGVLSTNGARKSLVYRDLLEPKGYEVLEVDDTAQENLHDAIYNPLWGLKATREVTEKAASIIRQQVDTLASHGAERIILGCTELSLVFPNVLPEDQILIDPLILLARALVREVLQPD